MFLQLVVLFLVNTTTRINYLIFILLFLDSATPYPGLTMILVCVQTLEIMICLLEGRKVQGNKGSLMNKQSMALHTP